MVAAAVVGSGVVGAAATTYSANQAASAQRNAASQAINAQQNFFNQSKGELQPFIDTGNAAGNKIAQLEGLNGANTSGIQQTLSSLPGYQFASGMGLLAQQNSATARGLGLSGQAQYEQSNLANQIANQYYNNYLSGLQNTQNTGLGAAQSLTGAATTTGGNIGNNLVGAGNATAASNIATGSAIGNAAQGIPNGLIASQLLKNQGINTSGSIYDENGYITNGGAVAPNLANGGYGQIGFGLG